MLSERYRIEKVLGHGGMGIVYLATDERAFRRHVVIKIPLDFPQDNLLIERFKRECQQLIELNHPHIIQVLDLGETSGKPFIVMQYLSGGDLGLKIKKNHRLHLVEVLKWLTDIAEALDFIHGKNIIHRDVKPGNILFDEAENAFLADFGIAKMLQTTSLTITGQLPGSLDYLPPESAMQQPAQPTYDQYALATVLYKAISGELPFAGESPLARYNHKLIKPPRPLNALIPDMPNKCANAVLRAISPRPEERFKNCTDFAENFKQGLIVQAKSFQPAQTDPIYKQLDSTTLVYKNIRKFKDLKYLYSLIAFVVLMILIIIGWSDRTNKDNIVVTQNSKINKPLDYFTDTKDSSGIEPIIPGELIRATQLGNYKRLNSLLQAGIDPNDSNEEGTTALILAATLGDTKIVESLLAAGADPNVEDIKGWTALVHASWQGNAQVVRLLLEAGVDPNEKNAIALITAIIKGDLGITKALVNAGADVNTRDTDGIPALILIIASEGSHRVEIARTLLAAGANPRVQALGKTPLMIAEQKHDTELIELLTLRLEDSNAWTLEKTKILNQMKEFKSKL